MKKRKKTYTLVKFRKNWSDEFDCEDLVIVEGSIDVIKSRIEKNLESSSMCYFGTNEGWSGEYGDEIEISDFEFTEVSGDDARVFVKVLYGRDLEDIDVLPSFGLGAAGDFLEE